MGTESGRSRSLRLLIFREQIGLLAVLAVAGVKRVGAESHLMRAA